MISKLTRVGMQKIYSIATDIFLMNIDIFFNTKIDSVVKLYLPIKICI